MRRVFGKHLIRGLDQDVRVLGPGAYYAPSGIGETLGCFRETRRDLFQLTAGQMQLAKNVIDLGLSTNNLEPMLRFWQQNAGLQPSTTFCRFAAGRSNTGTLRWVRS